MKKLFEITGIIMAIALVMIIVYHLVNTIPPGGTSHESIAITIFDDASCMTCHQKNTSAPFYSKLPLIGPHIQKDIRKGYQLFDMEEAWQKLKQGEPINEAHLAKIEMETVINHTMPPAKHYLLHWGASITPAKQTLLENWLRYHRETFYPNALAAEPFKLEPVRPIPTLSVDRKKADLGKLLFYDTHLSSDNSISCASCHNLQLGGANNRQFTESIDKRMVPTNTPSIYNACLNTLQSWNGETESLEAFIKTHLTHPAILGNTSFDNILPKLEKNDALLHLFEKSYKDGITKNTLTDALASFSKTLLTADCSFDNYLKGDAYAINKKEIFGYALFKSCKCATCHTGANMGGLTRERMGRHQDYFRDRGWELTNEDLGHFNNTGNEDDRYLFKVPGLRNVALTKPYFHDGSQQSLYDAVSIMAIYQTNQHLSEEETKAIVAFLETLTGESKTESRP